MYLMYHMYLIPTRLSLCYSRLAGIKMSYTDSKLILISEVLQLIVVLEVVHAVRDVEVC